MKRGKEANEELLVVRMERAVILDEACYSLR